MKKKYWFIIIAIPLIIAMLFECTILGFAYFGADEIECNLLWCEFKTTKTNISQTIEIHKTSECYTNGVKVNCSSINMGDFNVW